MADTTLQITYDDKVDVNSQSSYQINQLWTAENANEVKDVVNQIATFYNLNLTSDGWKFNFVSSTDRSSAISADTDTFQYISSNSADSSKNINYSGNALFYSNVSAISQMVPNGSGSYNPQPFLATNPEHLTTKAYVDLKYFETTIATSANFITASSTSGTTVVATVITLANTNYPNRNLLFIEETVSGQNLPRRHTILQIGTDNSLLYIGAQPNDNLGGMSVDATVRIYYCN